MPLDRSAPAPEVHLRLYVTGNAPNSAAAIVNLRGLGERLPATALRVELVDLAREPWRVAEDGVLITPTLLRADRPLARVPGNLSRLDGVLAALRLDDGADE